MNAHSPHAGQTLLPDTHLMAGIPDVPPLGKMTAAADCFSMQFTNRGTGKSHRVQPCTENTNGDFKLPQTVKHGEPPRKRQRIDEGAEEAGSLSQPSIPAAADVEDADPWIDTQKTNIRNSYAEALEALRMPGLSPLECLQKLEAFRTTCHRLINESWQLLRLELADAIAAEGEAVYEDMAPALAEQTQTKVVPFYDGFEPWGLQVLNASLVQVPMLGQVVQVSLLPTGSDGSLVSPWLPVLRSPPALASFDSHQPHQRYQPQELPAPLPLARQSVSHHARHRSPLPVVVSPVTQAGESSTTTTTTTAAGRASAMVSASAESDTSEAPLHDELEPLFSGFGDHEFR